MAQPYVGEIRMFAGNFPPAGWMFCEGQMLPISENETLFNLIGTAYGGDGESTFGLPDLRGRSPMHFGTGQDGITYQLAEPVGVETVTLTPQQTPSHTHPLMATLNSGTSQQPGGAVPAVATSNQPGVMMYGTDSVAQMYNQSIGTVGGNEPHENRQPYLCVDFIISLFGIFPFPT